MVGTPQEHDDDGPRSQQPTLPDDGLIRAIAAREAAPPRPSAPDDFVLPAKRAPWLVAVVIFGVLIGAVAVTMVRVRGDRTPHAEPTATAPPPASTTTAPPAAAESASPPASSVAAPEPAAASSAVSATSGADAGPTHTPARRHETRPTVRTDVKRRL